MNNKKNIIILFLSLLLLGVFLYQGKVIKDFSKEPERVEVIFKSDDPLIESILEEVEFIEEKYVMKSTSLGESLIRLDLEKPENIGFLFFE